MSPLRCAALLAGAVLLAVPTARPVYAGVIVLENGNVLVGRIRPEEVNRETITIRWPYKERTDRGHQDVERYRVRWFDVEADAPTDEYWEKYNDVEKYVIDNRWIPLLEKWRLRQKTEDDNLGAPILVADPFASSKISLSHIPIQTESFTIQKPEGWTSSIEDGITIFLSDEPGKDGFRARIHVFAVESVQKGRVESKVEWFEQQVARLADDDSAFDVRERKRLKPRASGFDQVMLTKTQRLKWSVLALRKLMFREKRTYFFSAYAHEQDYSALGPLFEACMNSFEADEDRAPSAAGAGGPAGAPGGGAGGGGEAGQ